MRLHRVVRAPSRIDSAIPVRQADTQFLNDTVDTNFEGHERLRRRKVILVKPLPEPPPTLADFESNPLRISREDSNRKSLLSFSPTSVLPEKHSHFPAKVIQRRDIAVPDFTLDSDRCKQAESLGSWVTRQVVHDLSSHDAFLPEAVSSGSPAPTTIAQEPRQSQANVPPVNTSSTMERAWRWRFKQRWRKEQLRSQLDDSQPGKDDSSGSDPWHDALHMMQAANTRPDGDVPICDHDCYTEASPSPLLDEDDLDELLELDCPATVMEHAVLRTAPSRALAEAAVKARELRRYQVAATHSCCF